MMKIGSIVRSTAGKNQDRFFVVVSMEQDCALVCDGRKRKLDHPKRKKCKHLEDTEHQLDLSAVTTNKQLRKALTSLGFFRANA